MKRIFCFCLAFLICFCLFGCENRYETVSLGEEEYIYGEIVEIDRDMETFVLKTGSEENYSFIKVDKMAIYQVIPPIDPQPEEQFGEEGQVEETTEVTEENN